MIEPWEADAKTWFVARKLCDRCMGTRGAAQPNGGIHCTRCEYEYIEAQRRTPPSPEGMLR